MSQDGPGPVRPRWPLWMWAAQLVLPLGVLAYVLFRLFAGPAPGRLLLPVSAACAIWASIAVVPLAKRSGRVWIVSRRKQLVLLMVTGFVTFAFIDLALTLSGIVPTIGAARRHALEYVPTVAAIGRVRPNQVIIGPGGEGEIRINSRGLRGDEFQTTKPEGRLRVIVFGGSQVFDFDGIDWPAEAGALLRNRGLDVEVLNAGAPGYRTPDSVGKFLTDLWMLAPDVVVLCQAWNDIKYFAQVDPDQPYGDVVRPLPRDWRIRPQGLDRVLCVSALYRLARLQLMGSVIGVEGERPREATGRVREWGPRQYELDVATFCSIADSLGASVIVCKQARLPVANLSDEARARIRYEFVGLPHEEVLVAFEACDDAIERVAATAGADVLDLHARLSGRSEYFVDHIHLNPSGSRAAAKALADQIAATLERR